MKQKIAHAIFINFAVLLLLLLCFEIVLRATGIGYDSAAFVPDSVLHHVHKKDYTFVNDNPAASEYSDILIRYDKEGRISNPDQAIIPRETKSTIKVALLGDSFTEAAQVIYSESFAGLLEKRFADTVLFYNYGVGEYSPVFYYLQSVYQLSKEKYDYVIMMLYSNDVRDDSVYYDKAVKDPNGNPVAISGATTSDLAELARKSYLLRLIRKYYIRFMYWMEHKEQSAGKNIGGYIEELPLLSQLSKKFIQQTDSVLKLSGAELILSAVPSKYKLMNQIAHDSTDFANQVKLFAEQQQLPYINLVPAFEKESKSALLFFPNDIHFNKNGHQITAQKIEEGVWKKINQQSSFSEPVIRRQD